LLQSLYSFLFPPSESFRINRLLYRVPDMAPVIGYWGLRGLVNPIRLLLEYAGEKYEYKDWSNTTPGWFEQKNQLGLPFPNLPYLIDGQTKLTQSGAIMKYFARKHGLVATNEKDLQEQDMLEGVFSDIRMAWGMLCYGAKDFETEKMPYRQDKLQPTLKQFDEWLSKKEYLVGNKLSYSDFIFFEIVDVNTKMFPDLLNEFPNVKKFHQKIAGLKGVKEYLASDRNPTKINGPQAKWGG